MRTDTPALPTAPAIIRRVHPASIVLAVVGAVMFVLGAALAGLPARPAAPAAPALSAPTEDGISVVGGAPGPVPTIREGTWVVGTDVQAGTYRAAAEVSFDCYWKIMKSGTNGKEIIDSEFPGGGRPVVTLQEGQDFYTSRCGTWTKIA